MSRYHYCNNFFKENPLRKHDLTKRRRKNALTEIFAISREFNKK